MSNEIELDQEMAVAWADIKESQKRGRVLYAKAIGIEVLEFGTIRKECLKLDYKGIYGYLPKDLIDDYEFRGLQNLLGGVFEFVVNHVDFENHIFGADRIQALQKLASRFWRTAKEGEVYEAFVRGVDPFNVYLLIEGVPSKMHRDEFSYTFYDDLREVVDIGEIIEVKVKSIEPPSKKEITPEGEEAEEGVDKEPVYEDVPGLLEVSRKELETNPLTYIKEFKEKATYLGTIKKVHMDHGLFIELPKGITVRANFPPYTDSRLLKEGEQINVKIQSIDLNDKNPIKVIVITPKQSLLKQKSTSNRRGLIQ